MSALDDLLSSPSPVLVSSCESEMRGDAPQHLHANGGSGTGIQLLNDGVANIVR